MQVLVAIDSFKGSATSLQAAQWVKAGLLKAAPEAQVETVPIADGGEGTVAALTTALHGQVVTRTITGPLGQPVAATFGMLDAHTAVIEMAQAAGLHLTQAAPAQAMRATTKGVGELLLAAIDQGAGTIYVGLGGSATTDGGAGMAAALGVRFLDAKGREIGPGARGLAQLATVDASGLDPRLAGVAIKLLSDVTNPLTGANGAAAVYGPQKGLTQAQVPLVDTWLTHYAALLEATTGKAVARQPGAGAAGGLGAGLLAFTNAKVYAGIDELLRLVNLEAKLAGCALVITGEGRMDAQSLNGKAPIGIAKMAKRHGVPVVALVGSRAPELDAVYAAGISAVWAIQPGPLSLQQAQAQVAQNLTLAGETAMRAFLMKGSNA